ncbi:MAG: EAL domain-containing protein [Dactylosporangium sp.]|nr:EAL domain-containing protein [Dactylosporangium sp.]NNJ62424.1 EAL domain-containing protein [Dactylosporangium sp.]
MTATPGNAQRHARAGLTRAFDLAPPTAGLVILTSLLTGTERPALTIGLAVWIASARPVARMIQLARASFSDPDRRQPRWALAFLALGSLLTAVATVGSGFAELLAPTAMVMEVRLPVEIPNVMVFLAAIAFLPGLMLLPGTTPTLLGRLRWVLDGAGIGICVLFTIWVLVFTNLELLGAAVTATLASSVAIGIATIAGLRAARHHWRRLTAGIGVVISIAGLAGLTITLDFQARPPWLFMVGTLLASGPSLVRIGATEIAKQPSQTISIEDDGSFSMYPVLAIPLGGGILAAGYHFLQQRVFDTTSIVLGIAGVALVALREGLAALDVRRYAIRLAAQRAHFRSLFAGSTDVTLVLDDDQVVRWQSPAAARLLGLSDQDVVGRSLFALFHPDDADQVDDRVVRVALSDEADDLAVGEARMRDGFGGWRHIEIRMTDLRTSPEVGAIVAHIRDISERKELELSLRQASFADQLTTLPNRRELLRFIAQRHAPGVVMAFCLDGVEGVNDAHGREVGEAVLVEAARRLRDGVNEGDLPVRLDGDKLAVVTASGAVQAQIMATRLLTSLANPYELPGTTAYVAARAGLAELEPDREDRIDADDALRCAELALRRARRRGRGGAIEWHDASVDGTVRRQLAIEQQLPGAIARGELELRFQPIVDLIRLGTVGAEAVITWRHPSLGTVSASELLPVAEEVGLGPEIHEWGLHRICRQLSAWLHDHRDLWVSFDVSAEQLTGPEFLAAVTVALETHGVPAANLAVEVSEADLHALPSQSRRRHGDRVDPAADTRAEALVSALTELRQLGVRVALDHFGTETTSLHRLRLLPVDLLKVDRCLVAAPVDSTGPATALIDVMVKFSHQLGLEIAVQDLEDEGDVEDVRASGCRYGQGRPFSEPLLAEHFEAYVDSHRVQRF